MLELTFNLHDLLSVNLFSRSRNGVRFFFDISFFYIMFCRSFFILLLLAIVLSALLHFTISDYHFVIFKLFLG